MNVPDDRESRRARRERNSAPRLVLTPDIEDNEKDNSGKNIMHGVWYHCEDSRRLVCE